MTHTVCPKFEMASKMDFLARFKTKLRVLPTAEFLNITKKYEIKAHLRGRRFLSVPGRAKRTSVPGLSNREISFFMSG